MARRREQQTVHLMADGLVILLVLLFLGSGRPDLVVIIADVYTVGHLLATRRTNLLRHFLLAFVVASIWAILARGEYNYNLPLLTLGEVNLFPLFAWSGGLFASYIIFCHFRRGAGKNGLAHSAILYISLYWSMLILIETMAYYVYGIRNLATAAYSGLPICGCIHAPHWMQATYLLIGPIYFALCNLTGFESRHR